MNLYSQDELKAQISSLISDHGKVEAALKVDTALYNNDDKTDEMRDAKTLLKDEIHVPDRTISLNINQTQSRLISYLRNGESLVTFALPGDTQHAALLKNRAMIFTQGVRVRGWEEPWYKAAHNGLLYGRGFMLVVQDPKMPLQVAFEHIPTVDMLIPEGTVKLQDADVIAIRYQHSKTSFMEEAKRFRWSGTMTTALLEKHKASKESLPFMVYHVFYKAPNKAGEMVVHDCWYTAQDETNFLREEAEYMTGLVDVSTAGNGAPAARAATAYPVSMYLRKWDSNSTALAVRGQAEQDAPTQAALTMGLGAITNGTHRASRFILSPDAEKGQDAVQLENMELKHGIFSTIPFKPFQPAYPSAQITSFMQQLRGSNLQANGNTDFAAMTREDSEKRVKELAFAKQTADNLAEASVAPWAAMVHDAMAMAWAIVQSQALLGQVQLMEQADTLALPVVIAPFGEFDTLARARFRQRLIEFWPIVKDMPGALPFYEAMLSEFFPMQAQQWFTVQGHIDQMQAQLTQTQQLIMQVQQAIVQYAQKQPELAKFAAGLGAAMASLGIQPGDAGPGPAPQAPQG